MRKNLKQRVYTPSGILSDDLMQEYRRMYGEARVHGALLQALYTVDIENIYHHKGDIPWFSDDSLAYLVTEADISLGTAEADEFHAGAHHNHLLTKKSSNELELSFIETANGDIARSYYACDNLAFNKDGTVNEPRKYAFRVTVAFLKPKNIKEEAFSKSWIVSVLSGNTQATATGRSDVVKHTITFQKLRPSDYE